MPIIEAVCAQCSATIRRYETPYCISRRKAGPFCDRACYNAFRMGRYRLDEASYRRRYRCVTRRGKSMGEHCWVMEQILGRELRAGEVVHHRDGNGLNNRPENLVVVSDQTSHLREHHRLSVPTDRIEAMYANGLSVRAIAKELGIGKETVRGRLRDAGIRLRSNLAWRTPGWRAGFGRTGGAAELS